MVAQGGKDGLIRLLGISNITGASAHIGGELQTVLTPPQGGLGWRRHVDVRSQ
jgi:hypothetical protein